MIQNKPIIGTHIILLRNEKEVLLGKRKKEPGRGEWELPGGHLKFQESLEDCLVRECQEELGIKAKIGKLVSVSPNMEYGNHYIIFTFLADSFTEKPELKEPDKHESWNWFDLNNLPSSLFIATKLALKDYLGDKIYQSRF